MNRILSLVRRCVEDYEMIAPNDRVAVGVSGGKDSLMLLTALAKLREFYPIPFEVEAITLDMGHADGRPGMDFTPVARYCQELGVPYTLIPSEIHHIIFDVRKEKNPCSMCAKMRRGALHNAMKERGITKIALGHHYDDAVETLFMSLIFEGRLSCFQPVTWLDRMGITQIRPMLYCGEQMVRHTAQRLGADLRAQRPLSGFEVPGLWGHAAPAPACLGSRGAPQTASARGTGGFSVKMTEENSRFCWNP